MDSVRPERLIGAILAQAHELSKIQEVRISPLGGFPNRFRVSAEHCVVRRGIRQTRGRPFTGWGSNQNQSRLRIGKRIEQVLKEGDEVLVQVTKDAMGAKGARLTGLPSLPGRYLVLVPDSENIGISRRLPDEDRTRLREIINKVRPEGFGVIVRTAALHASAEELAADISRLLKDWDKIQEEATGGSAPRLIHEEPELLIKVIREHFTADFRKLLIDDREAYDLVVRYLQGTAPDLVSKVAHYEDEIPLFDRYHVDDQLKKALDRKVYLPSGGHLVIDRSRSYTPACIALLERTVGGRAASPILCMGSLGA